MRLTSKNSQFPIEAVPRLVHSRLESCCSGCPVDETVAASKLPQFTQKCIVNMISYRQFFKNVYVELEVGPSVLKRDNTKDQIVHSLD